MSTYPLRTDRLSLSPLGASDLDAFVAYRRDPAIARWQSWDPTYSHADARRLLAGQPTGDLPAPGEWLQLAIHDAAATTLHGDVAVHTLADQPDTYELGVTLAPAAHGRGIATEAVGRVVDHLVGERGAHRLVGQCDARNEPVARLFRRLGFRHEGRNVDADFFKGEWTTLDTYALLDRERPAPVAAKISYRMFGQ
ncbi:GNAT family N-acetyltransferase [Actinokineospora bangkokensis]|uniref:N-acetyltransferase domain-containing protein n=1 Tax=Actinokineospora bangkokensis TaxID=1193682 RepID=A0A1Q9LLD5_9PSEU|nr:GNAT family protein [Actinokineospora bangkokensis]OLR92846.1 hypothetical protein BJP25_19705 [Actinokineospora bangkokensis]